MIPGKINTHLLQDLTVLAKASQKGSIVYISPDKKIHSGTIFQKLKALIFRNPKDTSLENNRPDSNQRAKTLVITNLENQLRLFLNTEDIKNNSTLDLEIKNIAEKLVDELTKSNISSKNDIFPKLNELLKNYKFTVIKDEKSIPFENLLTIKNAITSIEKINASSEKNKLRFMATQINEANQAAQEVYIDEIKSISENAAWVQKYKGVASDKALSLGKEMNRSELSGLTNNQKFNILQKAIKSLKDENTSESKESKNFKLTGILDKLAKQQALKNYINKLANDNQEFANFIKIIPKEKRYTIDVEETLIILNHNKNNVKLTDAKLYETYKQTIHG